MKQRSRTEISWLLFRQRQIMRIDQRKDLPVVEERDETRMAFDPQAIKADFPIFARKVHDKPLVYLDNAATTQKPECVIEAIENYYRNYNSNVHRGMHVLAEEATEALEASRASVARF